MLVNPGHLLLPLARAAISHALGGNARAPAADAAWLQAPGAAFVTLIRDGRLRGRRGTLDAMRTLHDDVTANAVEAALRDPCFAPLTSDELAATEIEVAVLSKLETVDTSSEAAALSGIHAGMHGLALSYGHHHGIFLPEAWAEHADPADFLAHLKYRAGLPPDFWDPVMELRRYTVARWRDTEV
ncbi:MAG: AmmeMemoRadiSam system protein A [Burkholderiales bacterium]|nr:AmmeMemoRadiSam system protein A [Burkholderiales bacterium]